MVYANYSQGYKAGGFNSRGTTPENIGPYGPEHVNAFEVGAKTDLFDRLLRFNVAGFVNNYRNLQGSVTTMGAVRPENITTKIAAAKIYGVDRKSGVKGKSVAGRVNIGGHSRFKKKTKN